MGRIFKTPNDDAVENTLKSIHFANRLDVAYERGWGWLKVILFSLLTATIISAIEHYTEWSLWDRIVERTSAWAVRQLEKLV